MRFLPDKPKTFLFIFGLWLLTLGLAHNQRANLTQSVINVLNPSPLWSSVKNWGWNELTPLFAGSIITLVAVAIYNLLGYESVGSKEKELMSKLDVDIASRDQLRIAVDQLRASLPQYTVDSESFPEMPEFPELK